MNTQQKYTLRIVKHGQFCCFFFFPVFGSHRTRSVCVSVFDNRKFYAGEMMIRPNGRGANEITTAALLNASSNYEFNSITTHI